MVPDKPPEVHYIKKAATKLTNNEDIPSIEEDEQDDDDTEDHHLITHRNTFQESERIRHEYSDKLQDIDDQQYYQQID